MPKLNPTQRRLIREIEQLNALFNLNGGDITSDGEPVSWTPRLQLARNQLIRSQILMHYVFIDECLSSIMARYFFPKRSFILLWRTKRFRLFNYHILEELSLLKKMQFVSTIQPVPAAIRADIERLNAVRNGIAHSFFPENLKRSKPVWKGSSIFSLDGVQRFEDDMERVVDFLVAKAFGVSRAE